MDRGSMWNRWESIDVGVKGTLSYRRIFIDGQGREVSPWRDIPLYASEGLIRCLCKTPKGNSTAYHVEITEDDPSMKLALRKGQICTFSSPSPWNIGMLPQTWADPSHSNTGQFEGMINDGQPIEVIDIGNNVSEFGKVSIIKPIAIFALSNTIHLTWYILGINIEDPLAASIDNTNVERYFPNLYDLARHWLQNCYGEEERVLYMGNKKRDANRDIFTLIKETHSSWKIFNEIQDEWRQRSAEIVNYGRVIWENYTVHDSKATICSSSDRTLSSGSLYDLAWANLDLDYCAVYGKNGVSFEDLDVRGSINGGGRRGDMLSYLLRGRKNSRVTHAVTLDLDDKEDMKKSSKNACFPFINPLRRSLNRKITI